MVQIVRSATCGEGEKGWRMYEVRWDWVLRGWVWWGGVVVGGRVGWGEGRHGRGQDHTSYLSIVGKEIPESVSPPCVEYYGETRVSNQSLLHV